jgi:glycosyltransferase involved in cell wall biosynthesis
VTVSHATNGTDQEIRLAYLTSQYPATSHTFISREVAALRKLGLAVDTFSIRPPAASEMQDEALRREASTTFTVLGRPLTDLLLAQFAALLTWPVGYFRTLARALSHRPPGLRGFARSFIYSAEAAVLARELKRRKITRLHNHFANAGAIVGYLAAGLPRLPWSFTMHGISEFDYPAGLLLAEKIKAADFVVCVSSFGRAQAMRLVPPEQWNKLHVIRCGLPMDALPDHSPAPSGRIISVGRLSPEKGQAGLLEAFAAVSQSFPELQLILVGDGPEGERLQALAKRLHIADRVRFAGRCSERDTLIQIAQADILILSSFMEGLPIVLMEAMAVGTAVIASRVAGIPELVEDGKTGLLFTPSNWDELADCIRRLVGDDQLRSRLTKRGRAAVAAEFDIEQSAIKLRDLFVARASQ